jgi:predicted membrane-bound spermidine synthase
LKYPWAFTHQGVNRLAGALHAMTKPTGHIKLKQLYFISFIEGGVVMVTEIAGAKLLTPFFGATLYSWAATLSITLLALMSGYYFGGYITTKPKFTSPVKIIWVFFASGLSVFLMPTLGHFVMKKTIALSFFTGLILSELIFLFLPIFLMGMISPMIIFQITKKAEHSGRSAGNIYAISTCGGILFTLVFGFLIIPEYGISAPVRLLGIVVCLIGIALLLVEKLSPKIAALTLFPLFLVGMLSYSSEKKRVPGRSNLHLLESSEGLMGELKVIDQVSYPPNGEPVTIRRLRINNIVQNYVFAELPTQSLLYYVNFTKQLLGFLKRKESALLIGLGAGSIYKILNEQYKEVETVEIDKRMYDMGIKYFGLVEPKNNFITDGRYFINVTKKKYDLIIVDAIVGENVPVQLTTVESFKRLYEILNEDGTLIIENGGLTGFADNAFVPSLYKTMKAAGFHVELFNPVGSDDHGDAVFVCTKMKMDLSGISFMADVLIKEAPIQDYLLPLQLFDNGKAALLTDDKNSCDLMLKSHYFGVRKAIRAELAKYNFWE